MYRKDPGYKTRQEIMNSANEAVAGIPIIRSSRKTLSLEVRRDGTVLIRAPYRMSLEKISRFVQEKHRWIEDHKRRAMERAAEQQPEEKLTASEIQALADKALRVIPERVAYYAPIAGVTYGRITIRNQRTRWGSCSSKGNLNFNCLLMLMPPEVIDSVVVHELCHRLEPNHSERFYAHVLRVFPKYRECDQWIKKNGPAIMRKMTG